MEIVDLVLGQRGGLEHAMNFLMAACPALRVESVLAGEWNKQCQRVLESLVGTAPIVTDVGGSLRMSFGRHAFANHHR